jgi:hypothetical protein
MKRIQISLLLSVVVFATGCPKYRPKVDFKNPQAMVNKFNDRLKQQYHMYECYRFGPGYIDSQAKICEDSYSVNKDMARDVRNELIENALPYIDEAYIDFITDIQAGRDRNNYLMDLVELGAAASVGITKGERSLQIIGVALTAFRGGRKSLDANFYKDTSTPILISKMDGNRAKVRTTILQREKQEVSDYPLGAAISDIVDYYNAGTLVRAFTQLEQDTAVQTQQSETVLKLNKIDPSRIVVFAEADQDAAIRIGTFRKKYQEIFRGSDTKLQDAATAELLGIYSDIAASPDFKPVLDELKKDPKYKQWMDNLDSGDVAKIKTVQGVEIFELVSQVFFATDKLKKHELIVPLKDIFVKHTK